MPGQVERLCIERGLRMTGQRRVVARVLSDATDHPDAEEVYRRASALDSKISIATVYRTLRIFEEADILQRLEFGDGRARFERTESDHHDHLIDTGSGKVIEFQNAQLEELQVKIAHDLGYRLVGHRMELFGMPLAPDTLAKDDDSGDGN
ncbi:MAG: transcriptional repressor [Alphaproteobacteria bacterium]|nr:transcriptional repressor [Alphaproteobacteria bacterium]